MVGKNRVADAEGERPIQRQPLLVQYKHQAIPTIILRLVVSRNDKNKQLTLISQHKLALTARNKLFALHITQSLEPLKYF